jgi:ribosomal-protein-alanine N-acetyltransferase
MLADVPAIVALERRIATAPHWAEAEYAAMVTGDSARRCLLVADEGGIAGFAVGAAWAGEAELETVAVAEEFQRRGLGRLLCVAVMDWAWSVGVTALLLEVRAGSLGAIRLYQGLGFVEVGRRPRYYSDPADDAVLMRCELNPSR